MHDGTWSGIIDPRLTELVAEKLLEAVAEGYGKSLDNIDYNSPDGAMAANLRKNVYQFSAAKNYHQLKTMNLALIDEDGNARSFADFKDICTQVNAQYNETWLQTEYDTAIGSGQMAGKWAEFPDDAMLEYSTVGDERVRISHQTLDGVLKPKKDGFWNTYYPPNGWNCRCNVIESSQPDATGDDEFTRPGIPEMFQVNLAKRGLVFPDGHPYYKGIPNDVLKEAEKLLKKA